MNPMTPPASKAKFTLDAVADSSGSLQSTYLCFWDRDGEMRYFWLNVDSGGTDPAPAGALEGFEVAISENSTAVMVAEAVEAALADACYPIGPFLMTCSGNQVTVEESRLGPVTAPQDGSVGTGFSISTIDAGCFPDLSQAGTAGDLRYDSYGLYACTATDQWSFLPFP